MTFRTDDRDVATDASQGGPWTDADHAASPAFDDHLALAIADQLMPPDGWAGRTVLDWGGGAGWYLAILQAAGANVCLVEPLCSALPGIHQHRYDMGARPLALMGRYLTICLEVLEHVPARCHGVALDNVARTVASGGYLVFSGATPGQGGHGHVAERPESEWRAELASRGLVECPALTATLRAASTLPWLRSNTMVWRRPAQGAEEGPEL